MTQSTALALGSFVDSPIFGTNDDPAVRRVLIRRAL